MLRLFGSLTRFTTTITQLGGELPQAVWKLGLLQSLDAAGNNLKGSVAQGQLNLSALRVVVLEENELDGSLPAKLLQLPRLQTKLPRLQTKSRMQ